MCVCCGEVYNVMYASRFLVKCIEVSNLLLYCVFYCVMCRSSHVFWPQYNPEKNPVRNCIISRGEILILFRFDFHHFDLLLNCVVAQYGLRHNVRCSVESLAVETLKFVFCLVFHFVSDIVL